MTRLPPRPNLDQLQAQAKELLRAARRGDEKARARLAAVSGRQTLAAAQLVLAREYGLPSWARLKLQVETRLALDSGDLSRVAKLLADEPELARADLQHWADHPQGVSPLGYVAMLRYDTSRQVWREVVGTGAVAGLLLAAGAPVDGRVGDREPPLITAASYGDAEVAQVLLEAGADLEARAAADAGGVPEGTALLHAAVFGMTDIVDLLVAAGARVNGVEEAAAAGDLSGWLTADTTPEARARGLVMAADHERLEVIDQLVAAGTRVDGIDSFGRHPLRTAAAGGRDRSVTRLLAHGADPTLRDSTGQTALELALRGRNQVQNQDRHDWTAAVLVARTPR